MTWILGQDHLPYCEHIVAVSNQLGRFRGVFIRSAEDFDTRFFTTLCSTEGLCAEPTRAGDDATVVGFFE